MAIVFVLVELSWLIMEHVVEIGVFGYVYGEFGDTALRPCGHHINTMAKSSTKKS
jgi:hypothetical protein